MSIHRDKVEREIAKLGDRLPRITQLKVLPTLFTEMLAIMQQKPADDWLLH